MNNICYLMLSSAMLMSMSAGAAGMENRIIRAVDSQDYEHYYYYNAGNQLFWELYGTTRRQYEYNELGQKTCMTQYAWVEASRQYQENLREEYSYDADGNLVRTDVVKNAGTIFETKWTYLYSDFKDGVATYYDEYKNGSLYYMYKQVPVFDDSKRMTSCTVYYADPDKYDNPVAGNVDYADVDKTLTKEYDADGKLVKENDGKTGYEYSYTELRAEYVPKDFSASMKDGSVTLSWSSVSGAEKYIVSYDQERKEVEGTSYTAVMETGERVFTVQAVVGGIERNAAAPVSATVTDKGLLPVTDLAVGVITETQEATESAVQDSRTFFNIPLTWSLPEGHSEVVKFYVYYNSTTYGEGFKVAVTDPSATGYTLKVDPFEMSEWDADGTPYKGIDTPVYVTVVYVSGESEKSNVVTVNPFKTLGHEADAIESVASSLENREGYSITGVRSVTTAQGIVIRNGKKVLVR